MNNEYEKINSASINRAEEEHPGSKDKNNLCTKNDAC